MTKFYVSLCAVYIVLSMALLLSGLTHARADNIPLKERLISIDLQDHDFTQVMEVIAGQAGVGVDVRGAKPALRRDISFHQVPLGQAMAQLMRAYGVMNHAAAYDPEAKSIMLVLLKTIPVDLADDSWRKDVQEDHDSFFKPLTQEQLERLREQNILYLAQMEEAMKPLTQEQMELLREESEKIEAEMEEAMQPLTPEQMERLQEQSFWIELEMEEASQPLTDEQIERLREQSRRIQEEQDRAAQPLTDEQLRRLREQSHQ